MRGSSAARRPGEGPPEKPGELLAGHAPAPGDRRGADQGAPRDLPRRTDPRARPRRIAADAGTDPQLEPGEKDHGLLLQPPSRPGPEDQQPRGHYDQGPDGGPRSDRGTGQGKVRRGFGRVHAGGNLHEVFQGGPVVSGTLTVCRKELADHFSSTRFILLFFLIMMVSLVTAYMVGSGLRDE